MRRWLWVVAVGLRLLAAGLLVFGPWTDEPDELAGWDSSRFQQIHEAPGQPWVDHEVEYPPGSVVIMELIAGDGVVETQRTLIALSLVIDLGIAAFLAKGGPADLIGVKGDAGLAYLLLGLVAVPTGMLRLDLWATAGTAVGLLALGRATAADSRATSARERASMTAGFALAVAVGAAIKIAPGLLIPVAFAARRRAEAIAALGLGAALGGAWLLWAGGDALTQVLSLRGVTGWHLESVPGSLLALFTDEAPRLEADAYRIGTVSDTVVLAGRLVALAVVVWLGVLVNRRPAAIHAPALMMLGSTAALLVTAPLLSPQFLLWLTPPAALLWTSEVRSHRRIVWLTAMAIAITALTLVVFGPAGVGRPVAAAALLVRDGLLAMVVFGCMRAAQVGWNTRAGSTAPAHGQLVRSRRSTRWPR